MTNQLLFTSAVIVCSLGGWYVVLNKYFELKEIVKRKDPQANSRANKSKREPQLVEDEHDDADEDDIYYDDQPITEGHIPGMGPPPVEGMPFGIPRHVLESAQQYAAPPRSPVNRTASTPATEIPAHKPQANVSDQQKRIICNWASMIHLSGFVIVTGIPFLNVVLPLLLWLLKKEEHPYIAKQGRAAINFQITYTILQFMCLGAGCLFIWLMPQTAAGLFAWTKTLRVVFSTGMYLPFNIFTALPFFWACLYMMRGTVAAYHGAGFSYPLAQEFIFTSISKPTSNAPQPEHSSSGPVQQATDPKKRISFG